MNVDMEAEFKRQMLIEQLEKHGITDCEAYTDKELLIKLEAARALDIVVGSPHNTWF